jgi:hypothetical protein
MKTTCHVLINVQLRFVRLTVVVVVVVVVEMQFVLFVLIGCL